MATHVSARLEVKPGPGSANIWPFGRFNANAMLMYLK